MAKYPDIARSYRLSFSPSFFLDEQNVISLPSLIPCFSATALAVSWKVTQAKECHKLHHIPVPCIRHIDSSPIVTRRDATRRDATCVLVISCNDQTVARLTQMKIGRRLFRTKRGNESTAEPTSVETRRLRSILHSCDDDIQGQRYRRSTPIFFAFLLYSPYFLQIGYFYMLFILVTFNIF